jgi:predicted O-methyltransferase YrrM
MGGVSDRLRWYRRRAQFRAAQLRRSRTAHLSLFEDATLGPVQRDEALLLMGLIRVLRPRTVVEIGFLYGHSALNFLRAMDGDARLFSFDIDPALEDQAQKLFGHDPRFAFRCRSQTAIRAADLEGRKADFVFLDASHDCDLNIVTFERLLPLMAPRAIFAVHDTGAVARALVPDGHPVLDRAERWAGDEYEGEPGERAFVNRVLREHREFAQVHLHSERTLRCGITLLQRSAPLPRPGDQAAPVLEDAAS